MEDLDRRRKRPGQNNPFSPMAQSQFGTYIPSKFNIQGDSYRTMLKAMREREQNTLENMSVLTEAMNNTVTLDNENDIIYAEQLKDEALLGLKNIAADSSNLGYKERQTASLAKAYASNINVLSNRIASRESYIEEINSKEASMEDKQKMIAFTDFVNKGFVDPTTGKVQLGAYRGVPFSDKIDLMGKVIDVLTKMKANVTDQPWVAALAQQGYITNGVFDVARMREKGGIPFTTALAQMSVTDLDFNKAFSAAVGVMLADPIVQGQLEENALLDTFSYSQEQVDSLVRFYGEDTLLNTLLKDQKAIRTPEDILAQAKTKYSEEELNKPVFIRYLEQYIALNPTGNIEDAKRQFLIQQHKNNSINTISAAGAKVVEYRELHYNAKNPYYRFLEEMGIDIKEKKHLSAFLETPSTVLLPKEGYTHDMFRDSLGSINDIENSIFKIIEEYRNSKIENDAALINTTSPEEKLDAINRYVRSIPGLGTNQKLLESINDSYNSFMSGNSIRKDITPDEAISIIRSGISHFLRESVMTESGKNNLVESFNILKSKIKVGEDSIYSQEVMGLNLDNLLANYLSLFNNAAYINHYDILTNDKNFQKMIAKGLKNVENEYLKAITPIGKYAVDKTEADKNALRRLSNLTPEDIINAILSSDYKVWAGEVDFGKSNYFKLKNMSAEELRALSNAFTEARETEGDVLNIGQISEGEAIKKIQSIADVKLKQFSNLVHFNTTDPKFLKFEQSIIETLFTHADKIGNEAPIKDEDRSKWSIGFNTALNKVVLLKKSEKEGKKIEEEHDIQMHNLEQKTKNYIAEIIGELQEAKNVLGVAQDIRRAYMIYGSLQTTGLTLGNLSTFPDGTYSFNEEYSIETLRTNIGRRYKLYKKVGDKKVLISNLPNGKNYTQDFNDILEIIGQISLLKDLENE